MPSIAGQDRASQQKLPALVRYGSGADIARLFTNVRFPPESGQLADKSICPLCANSDRMRCSKNSATRSPRRRGRAPRTEFQVRAPSRSFVGERKHQLLAFLILRKTGKSAPLVGESPPVFGPDPPLRTNGPGDCHKRTGVAAPLHSIKTTAQAV